MDRVLRVYALFAVVAILLLSAAPIRLARALQSQPSAEAVEPAMKLLGRMVGGVWKTEGSFKAELRYEWRVPGKAVRGIGRAAIGTPQEFIMESLYGWDPAAKKVYYVDFHGHETVYKGWAEAADGKFTGEFEGLIGDAGKYRFADTLTDENTLSSEMFAKNKAGDWVKIHGMTFKRHPDKS